jgi:prepilin-type processing-associated H-X9-DG protein
LEDRESGSFDARKWLRAADFRDGISNTAAFSEKVRGSGRPGRWNPRRDFWFAGFTNQPPIPCDDAIARCAPGPPAGEPPNVWAGWCWYLSGLGTNEYNHVGTPNLVTPDCTNWTLAPPFFEDTNPGSGVFPPRSWHRGGVNVTMADGSLRFVRDAIAVATWRALGTRAGGEPVPAEF